MTASGVDWYSFSPQWVQRDSSSEDDRETLWGGRHDWKVLGMEGTTENC
jgi:hypothetical protein